MFRLRSPRILRGFARRVLVRSLEGFGEESDRIQIGQWRKKGFYFFDYLPNIASSIFVLVITAEGINPDITDTHIIISARTK
ncbi:MAG: hypothetical protein BWY19_01099 [bacterium ADurb.Bin212]|jgi:hypothetical protein|nr:MAG: hypothetical protein BWY19_01099 [bacterium ADurb.Bin212]